MRWYRRSSVIVVAAGTGTLVVVERAAASGRAAQVVVAGASCGGRVAVIGRRRHVGAAAGHGLLLIQGLGVRSAVAAVSGGVTAAGSGRGGVAGVPRVAVAGGSGRLARRRAKLAVAVRIVEHGTAARGGHAGAAARRRRRRSVSSVLDVALGGLALVAPWGGSGGRLVGRLGGPLRSLAELRLLLHGGDLCL